MDPQNEDKSYYIIQSVANAVLQIRCTHLGYCTLIVNCH